VKLCRLSVCHGVLYTPCVATSSAVNLKAAVITKDGDQLLASNHRGV